MLSVTDSFFSDSDHMNDGMKNRTSESEEDPDSWDRDSMQVGRWRSRPHSTPASMEDMLHGTSEPGEEGRHLSLPSRLRPSCSMAYLHPGTCYKDKVKDSDVLQFKMKSYAPQTTQALDRVVLVWKLYLGMSGKR